jgi:hypothetical protein
MDSVSSFFWDWRLYSHLSSHHHHGEETVFFAEVEKATGQKGIMDQNIEQHHSFYAGMETWNQYCSECMRKGGSQKFNSTEFRKLIDDFAHQLVTHLREEIPTLLALDKYDIAGVRKAWDLFDKHVQSDADVVGCIQTLQWEILTVPVHDLSTGNGNCRLDLRGR